MKIMILFVAVLTLFPSLSLAASDVELTPAQMDELRAEKDRWFKDAMADGVLTDKEINTWNNYVVPREEAFREETRKAEREVNERSGEYTVSLEENVGSIGGGADLGEGLVKFFRSVLHGLGLLK